MNKLAFLILEGFKNLSRHKLTVFTSVFSIYMSLLIVGSLFLTMDNSVLLVKYLRSKYKIEVFFKPDVDDVQAQSTIKKIKAISGVRSVTFISSSDAIKIFKDQFGEDIHSMLGYNPLPSSAVVNVVNNRTELFNINPIIRSIKEIEGIDTVKYQGRLIQRIERYYQRFVKGFVSLSGVVLLITIFIISSTIRLSVYARKELIRTLKLIGATRLFIITPFLIEGILHGVIGALLTVGTLMGFVHFCNIYLNQIFSIYIIYEQLTTYWIVGLSVIISLLGSYRAAAKFV